jgi:hypothetical protein
LGSEFTHEGTVVFMTLLYEAEVRLGLLELGV